MALLAIETSNPTARPADAPPGAGPAVALADPSSGSILGIEPIAAERRHDDDLLPAIERLCARLSVRPRDLEAIAVSIGPGGYTGLRVAITAAAAIAEARGIRVVPVPSAMVAAAATTQSGRALVCLASKRGACHATLFDRALFGPSDQSPATWLEAATDLGVIGPDRFEALEVDRVLADAHLPEAMRASAGSRGIAVEPLLLAVEAVARLGVGLGLSRPIEAVDPTDVRAIYAREPEAVRVWRGRA